MNTSPLRLPAGAGNRNPVVRTAFPDVSQELLDDKLDEYVRSIGVKAAFNLYNYQHMQAQQAEHVKSLYKLRPLLEHLLKVSRTGQIKYRFLKQSCLTLQQTFGSEVLQTHSEIKDASLAPGLVADCLTVLLNHWRRVTSSEKNFRKFAQKLDEGQAQMMWKLYKPEMAEPSTSSGTPKRRELRPNVSEVSLDSTGLPSVHALADFETPKKKATDLAECETPKKKRGMDPAELSPGEVSLASDGLPKTPTISPAKDLLADFEKDAAAASPPPAKKDQWKSLLQKKPAGALKKAAVTSAMAAEPDGPQDIKVHRASLSMGGGKDQTYIQHQPEAGGSKRLLVMVSEKMASRTSKTHKELIEMLWACCKEASTKADLLNAREKLLAKYSL